MTMRPPVIFDFFATSLETRDALKQWDDHQSRTSCPTGGPPAFRTNGPVAGNREHRLLHLIYMKLSREHTRRWFPRNRIALPRAVAEFAFEKKSLVL